MSARRRIALLLIVTLAAVTATAYPDRAGAAPWCGTVSDLDRPTSVGGHQIRVFYVIASDGVDRRDVIAPQISADIDAVEQWWQLNDSSRAPRFDRVRFECGEQADIRFHRLPWSAGELADSAANFNRVRNEVAVKDTEVPGFFKYVIYLDVAQAGVTTSCARGSGRLAEAGAAILYFGACSPGRSAYALAHTLLFALGAPPNGAPHRCTGDLFHLCDGSGDILSPFAQNVALNAYALDVGRDDYYGHSGSWPDAQDSPWLRHLDAQLPLTVDVAGGGRVTSDGPGVDCSAICQSTWDANAAVQLNAEPQPGRRLLRWSGLCNGMETPCSFSLEQAGTVRAIFGPATFRLRATVVGQGSVRARGFSCARTCDKSFTSFTALTLRAHPSRGWAFDGWTGACKGETRRCTLPMSADGKLKARFVRKPQR